MLVLFSRRYHFLGHVGTLLSGILGATGTFSVFVREGNAGGTRDGCYVQKVGDKAW